MCRQRQPAVGLRAEPTEKKRKAGAVRSAATIGVMTQNGEADLRAEPLDTGAYGMIASTKRLSGLERSDKNKRLAPQVGLEPTTLRLTLHERIYCSLM
jgi:hypothetical protein